jgi:hypothetical protein
MRYCRHSQWLALLVKEQDIILETSDRVQTLLSNLPDPDTQRPSLFVLIGNNAKARALRALFSISKLDFYGRRSHGEIHLHLDATSTFSDRPVLLADGDLPLRGKPKKIIASEKCHETISRVLPHLGDNTPTNLKEYVDSNYLRLLSLFIDVFYFFATDLGGLRPIVRRITSWLDMGQPSTLPRTTFPRLVIVMESNGPTTRDESTALKLF